MLNKIMMKISKICQTKIKIIWKTLLIKNKFLVIKIIREVKEFRCKWEKMMNLNFKIKFNIQSMIFSDKNSKIIKVLKISKLVNGIICKIYLKNMKKYIHSDNIVKLKAMQLLKMLLKLSLIQDSLFL
jgi:hypothetical protein